MSRELSALSRVTAADSLRDMDEIELEVFRADTRASRGISSADIAAIAEFDCEAHPIGAVIGHPKNDSPAKGTITRFRAEGNKLFATLKNVAADLVEGVKSGELLNRSMAFFSPDHEANPTPGKLAPRHLGFLGASAPGIPGMSPLKAAFEFTAEADGFTVVGEPAEAIIFEAPATPVRRIQEEPKGMNEAELKAERDRLDAERTAFEADRTAFAADAENRRKGANAALVAGLIAGGTVLPADKPALDLIFNALSDDELEFGANDKGTAAAKLAGILGKGPKLVDASGKPLSPAKAREFAAGEGGSTSDKARSITARAKEIQVEKPGLTFEAAVEVAQTELEG